MHRKPIAKPSDWLNLNVSKIKPSEASVRSAERGALCAAERERERERSLSELETSTEVTLQKLVHSKQLALHSLEANCENRF